jgi:ribose transport system permease protein
MPPQLLEFGRAAFGPFPLVFVAATLISIVVWFVLERTSFGRRLHAVGVNPLAARLIGVRTPQTIFIAFVVGGAIAGLAAILATARQGGGVPANGLNLVLPALAGTYLGATTIRPGQINIPGTFVGLLFVSVTVSGLTLLGLPAWVQPVFSGSALIVAVLIAHWFQMLAAAQK